MNKLTVIRGSLWAAPKARRSHDDAWVCAWIDDPATGAISCVWTTRRAAREPASPIPLRRAA
jgi:hypothetical protein